MGRIVAGLAGMAWSVVTFLVLPIIVIEGAGVGDAVRNSGRLFRRTWGENLAAQVGFGLLGFLAMLPGFVLFAIAAGGSSLVPAAVGVAWLIGVAIVMATLSGIFQTALYHYATDGNVPGDYFQAGVFDDAFMPRSRNRGLGF